jgi:hypothetical protein
MIYGHLRFWVATASVQLLLAPSPDFLALFLPNGH